MITPSIIVDGVSLVASATLPGSPCRAFFFSRHAMRGFAPASVGAFSFNDDCGVDRHAPGIDVRRRISIRTLRARKRGRRESGQSSPFMAESVRNSVSPESVSGPLTHIQCMGSVRKTLIPNALQGRTRVGHPILASHSGHVSTQVGHSFMAEVASVPRHKSRIDGPRNSATEATNSTEARMKSPRSSVSNGQATRQMWQEVRGAARAVVAAGGSPAPLYFFACALIAEFVFMLSIFHPQS